MSHYLKSKDAIYKKAVLLKAKILLASFFVFCMYLIPIATWVLKSQLQNLLLFL